MDQWIQNNIAKLIEAETVFANQKGKAVKSVRILAASPEIVEINEFFEADIEIFYIDNFTRHTIQLSILKLSANGTTLFKPLSHSESEVERAAKRYSLDNVEEPIYITNVLSNLEIAALIQFNDSKVNKLIFFFRQALEKHFTYTEVNFFHDIITSTRGKIINEYRKPIFIADLNDHTYEENHNINCVPADVYFKQIKPFDRKMPQGTVSDITVPILFNNAIPYGYLHVTSAKKVQMAILDQLNKIALKLNNQLILSKIFQKQPDKILITDASISGLGIVFTNRKLVTIFKKNALVNFDIIFPGGNNFNVNGICRNMVGAGQGKIKAGLEFEKKSVELDVFMQSYLDGIKK